MEEKFIRYELCPRWHNLHDELCDDFKEAYIKIEVETLKAYLSLSNNINIFKKTFRIFRSLCFGIIFRGPMFVARCVNASKELNPCLLYDRYRR
jgi:hypothetical protein